MKASTAGRRVVQNHPPPRRPLQLASTTTSDRLIGPVAQSTCSKPRRGDAESSIVSIIVCQLSQPTISPFSENVGGGSSRSGVWGRYGVAGGTDVVSHSAAHSGYLRYLHQHELKRVGWLSGTGFSWCGQITGR
jgi:hypothetical protein